jgi:hypothetical protein
MVVSFGFGATEEAMSSNCKPKILNTDHGG